MTNDSETAKTVDERLVEQLGERLHDFSSYLRDLLERDPRASEAYEKVVTAFRALDDDAPSQLDICDNCDGSGQGVADTVCSKCSGTGGQPSDAGDIVTWLDAWPGVAEDALSAGVVAAKMTEAAAHIRQLRADNAAKDASLEQVRKVREGYVSQMKFCDIEPLPYFREFVRRIDAALKHGERHER